MDMLHSKRTARADTEAVDLERGRHHGVVELVDAVDGVVRTRWVEGRVLADIGALSPEEVAGVVGAVAATVAELHERGVVHGGIDATHVLVTPEGRPVLCSLGRRGRPPDDVAAIGRLLAGLLDRAGSEPPPGAVAGRRALGSMLAPPAPPALAALAAAARADDPASRGSARQLATAIAEQVPGARLPRPAAASLLALTVARPTERRSRLRPELGRRRLLVGTAGLVGVILTGGWILNGGWAADDPRPATESAAPPAPPATTRSARRSSTTTTTVTTTTTAAPVAALVWPRTQLDFRDGVLTTEDGARYRLGAPGDAAVTGDWGCRGRPTVALLRPSTGEVFAFDDWAEPGRDVVARPVGEVVGATGLEPADVDGDGCAELLVTAPGREPVTVVVGR